MQDEVKKITRGEIEAWRTMWRMQPTTSNHSDMLVDFARDYGVLKEPVKKAKWAYEIIEPLGHVHSGVTDFITFGNYEYWKDQLESTMRIKKSQYWKLEEIEE